MDKVQSILALLILVALAFSPWVYMKARKHDRRLYRPNVQVESPEPEGLHYLRERLGRHMYGMAVGWDDKALADYDKSTPLQAMWQTEARYKIEGR